MLSLMTKMPHSQYDHHDAEGFINLFGLSCKVRAMKMAQQKETMF